MFQAIRKNFEKSCWTVSRKLSKNTRPVADCWTIYFNVSAKMAKFWESRWTVMATVEQRSRDRRSDCQTTFFDVWSKSEEFWKKSLYGHATVVGSHATVGRLSNNYFSTFQAIQIIFFVTESRWTATRQVVGGHANRWLTVQTTCFRRFERIGHFLQKVAKRSRDSRLRSRDRWLTVEQFISTCQQIWRHFDKSRRTVTRQSSEVTRPSVDCQTTCCRRFKQIGKILKKVAERSGDSRRRSRDRWLTVEQFISTFQQKWLNFEKVAERSGDSRRRSRNRRSTVNYFFSTFQANRNFLKKVAERSHDNDRKSRDRRPTVKQLFFHVPSNRNFFFTKVAKRSRDNSRRSRNRWPTFKQLVFDVSSESDIFWKKSPNGHATVVGGHATGGWLLNNLFRRVSEYGELLIKVVERSRNSRRRSRDRRSTV